MRVVVIGGTRFIGPLVVRRLSRMGHEVTVFHRGQTESDELPEVPHVHGDRQRLPDFSATFKQHAPDVVLDMLPMSEQDAQLVMAAFRGVARRVVAISSMDVYRAFARFNRFESGALEPVPFGEDAPLRERLYPYRDKIERLHDYEKILVERVVMSDANLPGTVLRLPFVYGPQDNQHRLFGYLKRMDDHRPAIILDDGIAPWRSTRGYVENVAAAIVLAATDQRAAGRIYNVGDAAPLSELEWVQAVGRAAGWTGHVTVVPRDRFPQHLAWWEGAETNQDVVADTTRIRTELGYTEPVGPDEALRCTVDCERANPPGDAGRDPFDYAAEDEVLAKAQENV
jgi:nucleoside-diphosphate-sugar epimerase